MTPLKRFLLRNNIYKKFIDNMDGHYIYTHCCLGDYTKLGYEIPIQTKRRDEFLKQHYFEAYGCALNGISVAFRWFDSYEGNTFWYGMYKEFQKFLDKHGYLNRSRLP